MCHDGNTEPYVELSETKKSLSGIRCATCGYDSNYNEKANSDNYQKYLKKKEEDYKKDQLKRKESEKSEKSANLKGNVQPPTSTTK